MTGFYSPTTWKKQSTPLSLVPQCGACGLWQTCLSPRMPVSGEGKRKVLIVAEAPGENEDRQNKQLVGNAGQELMRLLRKIGVDMRRDCWLTNAVICRPTNQQGYNREPLSKEIGFCRPNLMNTIKALNPDVIIPLGKVACKALIPLTWKEEAKESIRRWAGWQIPSCKLNTWICPTYHTSHLLRAQGDGEGVGGEAMNPLVLEKFMVKHLHAAFKLRGKPWKEVPDWDKRCIIYHDPRKAVEEVERMVEQEGQQPILSFDYETTTLKPDGEFAAILCCAVSNGDMSIAFPWLGPTISMMSRLLKSKEIKWIGANQKFEERWSRKFLGHGVRNWHWDTVLGAHWLDCRKGIASVKFQAFVLFGVGDYDGHLEPYKKGIDRNCNSPNRLREVEPAELMRYCALDSLFEHMIYQEQTRATSSN